MYAGLLFIVEQIMFCNSGSPTIFQNFHFLLPPSEGGWGKTSDFFLLQNFGFLYLRKVKKFQTNIYMRSEATNKNVRAKLAPHLTGRIKTSNYYFGYCAWQAKKVPARKSCELCRLWRSGSTYQILINMDSKF